MAGKGDDYRPVNYRKWCENYESIFGKKDTPEEESHKKDILDLKEDVE